MLGRDSVEPINFFGQPGGVPTFFFARLKESGIVSTRRKSSLSKVGIHHGWVAQLAEQRTENPRVGGSIPPPATFSTPTTYV